VPISGGGAVKQGPTSASRDGGSGDKQALTSQLVVEAASPMERQTKMRMESKPPMSPPDREAVQAVNTKTETQTSTPNWIQPKRMRRICLSPTVEVLG
jgi:hypothetical protein